MAILTALLLFALGLAASSSAVPILVELTIKDPVGSLENPSSTQHDQFVNPGEGGGKGKSNEKGNEKSNGKFGSAGNSGNNGNSNGTDLKSLTLWLSTNGKDWTKISNDLVSYSLEKITAEINTKGKNDIFGSSPGNITGETGQTYYVGLSTSPSSYSAGSMVSARLVSWDYVSKTGTPAAPSTSVPEPAVWALFGGGLLGLAFAFRPRRRA
jgi:hypothetical protein